MYTRVNVNISVISSTEYYLRPIHYMRAIHTLHEGHIQATDRNWKVSRGKSRYDGQYMYIIYLLNFFRDRAQNSPSKVRTFARNRGGNLKPILCEVFIVNMFTRTVADIINQLKVIDFSIKIFSKIAL